jgi:hypothetical protein
MTIVPIARTASPAAARRSRTISPDGGQMCTAAPSRRLQQCSDELYGDVETACQWRWPSQQNAMPSCHQRSPPVMPREVELRHYAQPVSTCGFLHATMRNAGRPGALAVETAACPPMHIPFQGLQPRSYAHAQSFQARSTGRLLSLHCAYIRIHALTMRCLSMHAAAR